VAFLALAGPVRAAEPWSGVWQGTVGTAAVRACFGGETDPDQGAYFYLRYLKLISLNADAPSKPAWTESDSASHSKVDSHWSLSPAPGGALTGTWRSDGKSLPIHLTRVPYLSADESDAPCGGMTFLSPRLVKPTLTRRAASLDGTSYTDIVANVGPHLDVQIESFELTPATPVMARINAELARPLPKPGAKQADYLDCLMGATGAYGQDGQYADTLAPDLISPRWLVTEETSSSSCDGAHPNAGVTWRTWNLTTGAAVDPWSWFNSQTVQPRTEPDLSPTIDPKLRQLLIARWPNKDKDCSDVVESQDEWDVHPTRTGLAFWPQLPHVVFACSEDIIIPYSQLAPMLNASGQAAIASIIEDLRGLPPRPKTKG